MCILSSAHEPTLLCPAHSSVCFHIQFWTGADENAEPSAFLYPCVFELSVKDGGGHTRVTRGGGGRENQQRLGKPLGQLELLLPAGPQGWGGRVVTEPGRRSRQPRRLGEGRSTQIARSFRLFISHRCVPAASPVKSQRTRELPEAPLKVQGWGGGDKRGEQTWRVAWGITRHTDLLQDLSGGAHPAAPSTTVYASNPARMGV